MTNLYDIAHHARTIVNELTADSNSAARIASSAIEQRLGELSRAMARFAEAYEAVEQHAARAPHPDSPTFLGKWDAWAVTSFRLKQALETAWLELQKLVRK